MEVTKYIRTFEGDMETLKEGGVPELSLLPEENQLPIQKEIPVEEPSTILPPPLPPQEVIKPSPIETYEGDFSDKIKTTGSSQMTILAAEQDAATGSPKPEQKQKSQGSIVYLIAGIAFLIAGGAGAYFTYIRYISNSAPVVLAPTISAPIFVDEKEEISGTGNVLLQAIKQSINNPLADGAVRFLYTASSTTVDNDIFSGLQLPAPNILLRNIKASDSMAGVIFARENQSPFFILSVASYSDTFSGMLSWESTMPRDLAQLFPAYEIASTTELATTTVASSTTFTAEKSSQTIIVAGFRDEIVGNHDARVYRDTLGRYILIYGYWNQTTLIIARDSDAFTGILDRLATSYTQNK